MLVARTQNRNEMLVVTHFGNIDRPFPFAVLQGTPRAELEHLLYNFSRRSAMSSLVQRREE